MQSVTHKSIQIQIHPFIDAEISCRAKCEEDSNSTSAGSSDQECDNDDSPTAPTVPWRVRTTAIAPPPGFAPRTSISPPPGLTPPRTSISPPPGLERQQPTKATTPLMPPPGLQGVTKAFSAKDFRRELVATLKELASNHNVAAAVRRIRTQQVPKQHQAREFSDLLTRASEEQRGLVRRLFFAFAAGLLAAGSCSAFMESECLTGLQAFFSDVYPDLCEETPRLPVIVQMEVLPTLRSVLSQDQLNKFLPAELASK